MDLFLRPGTRLLRRLSVTRKFVVIALALLVPLSVLAGVSTVTAARDVRTIDQEVDGLRMVRPLVRLIADLHQWRIAAVTGHSRMDLTADLTAVDAAERAVGHGLGVHAEWLRLRHRIAELERASPEGPPQARGAGSSRAPASDDQLAGPVSRQAVSLLDRLAGSSGLALDPRLDSASLAAGLVDRVPALLDAAATTAENVPAGAPPEGEAAAISRQVTSSGHRLTADLWAAVAGTTWGGLDAGVRGPVIAVQSAVGTYSTAASSSGLAGLARADDPGRSLTSSIAVLGESVADALAHLLSTRRQDSIRTSAVPLFVALGSITVAGYLFAALVRATSRDVREVLAEIHALMASGLHQSQPLPGSDEFAQMSRAAVVVRDHLTSLLGTLRYSGTHDELTALANRALFTEKLAELLAEPGGQAGAEAGRGARIGVVVVDLDGFKDVNDSFGHAIGDRLLRALGARVHRAAFRRGLVARIGADQFGVLVTDAGDDGVPTETVAELQAALTGPVDVDGRLLRVKASVGVAVAPDGGTTATELLRNADVAMHLAKRQGGGALAVFEPAMHEATRERTELSSDLVQAVEQLRGLGQQQFSVVYQPIVDLGTGAVHGVEALARWTHPDRGSVPPDVFIPLAEATGVIVPIGCWVLREAMRQLAAWQADLPFARRLTMDVNLAADQLGDPELVEHVLTHLSDTGVDPRSIVLEITESAVVQDLDVALRRLAQLSAMGVRVALDDFGTGYSSLSYLRQLPVSVLKIDKSFVSASDAEGRAAVLLRGIVSLGAGMGMEIVAEGVETRQQADRLRAAGCTFGQGYLWSRPADASEMGRLIRDGLPTRRGANVPGPRRSDSSPGLTG